MRPLEAHDAVVIGAGHNGLTAAAYLARAGLRTLVLERRDVVGGCAVTEEIAPGCRASTASYIASMFRPEIIRDLELGSFGLRMEPCEPAIQVAFPDGRIVPWWSSPERTSSEWSRFSPRDGKRFLQVDVQLKQLARYLQPFFLEPPPNIGRRGLSGFLELLRVGRRFHGITEVEIGRLVSFLTGSLADFLDRNFDSELVKTMYVANNVYGKHGGPFQAGTAMGLLFHLLSGGEHELQGFYGHVIGGMGAITEALASSCRRHGAEIRTGAAVERIDVRGGRARAVVLEDGTEIAARTVLSNADPKRTFLGLVDPKELPADFRTAIEGVRMNGPSAKVNFVLGEEPKVRGMPGDADRQRRSLFTLIPSAEYAERCYDKAKHGELSDDLWLDCVVATNVDPTLAPVGRHVMTCFVQYVPYRLKEGSWDDRRDWLGDRVVEILGEYASNVPDAVIARQVLTPLDLERVYGITEGNIFHGDLSLDQLFFMRPVPGWAQYRTPIDGLYLAGAGAHPGGGVTGAPGYNAAHRVLRDLGTRRA